MMAPRHARGALLVLAVMLASPVAAADAAFEAPTIVSARAGVQSNGTSSDVTVAAGGDHAVFRATSGNLNQPINLYPEADTPGRVRVGGGIFRRRLDTGALELVVARQLRTAPAPAGKILPGTLSFDPPSISADGRYVVFTTSMALVAADTNTVNDVYRRDMELAETSPEAYTLVSAIDGGDAALSYGTTGRPGSAAYRSAISEDGNRVAFQVTGTSNIGNTPSSTAALNAPAGQIAVRDIASSRTVLLSTTLAPPHGPAPARMSQVPLISAGVQLSGDGTTVVWDAPLPSAQVNLADATAEAVRPLLWKRVDDGAKPTARVAIAGADPDDPMCPVGGTPTREAVPGPCDGPLPYYASEPLALGALSRDGNTIAVTGNALRDSTLLNTTDGNGADAFLVDMRPGLSRKQAATRITAGADERSVGKVTGIALSPDGNWVAYAASAWSATSPGAKLPGPTGRFVPPLLAGDASVYVVDRRNNTVEQVSVGFDGLGLDGAAKAPSLSDDALVIGVETGATNLFYGDANGLPDAAVYRRSIPPPQRPTTVEVPAPIALAPLATATATRLRASARSMPNGSLRLTITAPQDGTISTVTRRQAVVRRGRKKAKLQPLVAKRRAVALRANVATSVDLAPTRSFAPTARRRGGLPATITLTFTAPGGGVQSLSLSARFVRTAPKAPATAPKASR